MGKIIGIVLVAALLGFGAYKIFSSSVDRTNPDAVGKAFLQALKKEDISRAKKYYLPAEADAWETSVKEKLGQMKTNAMGAFREAIPDEPTFAPAAAIQVAKGSTDKWVTAGGTTIALRQVDGEWFVTRCNQP